ncbi:MAG: AAA family ATPase, partial [Pseudomonadota bacterium]
LTNARAELAAIQARKLEAESVRETRSLLESTADVIDSTLVEDLRVREIELEQEAITLRDRLLPGHPELVRVNRELGQIRARIGAEIGKVVQSISSEENTLIAEIEVLERTLETADTDVVRLNKAEREIQALSMELVTNRSLLETFVARSRETEVQEDFQQADAQVIAPAEIPHNPSGPNRMIWSLLSFIAAIGAAGGGVVLRDRADPRARTIDAIRDITKIPLLSILPDVGGLLRSKRLALHEIVRTDKTANITDIMRRTYLKLSTSPKTSAPVGEANARSGKPAGHVILVTSSRPDEGKTSTACSLAMTARRFGKSVLVIDGDLRRPSIAQAFGIKSDIGIADYLCEEANLDEIIDEEPSLGIHCIVRGSPVSDPAELVDLNQMRRLLDVLARHYDLVVIDSAPVLAAPETRELARLADQIIFVMNWKNTKRREFASAIGEMSGIAHFDDRASLILNQVPAVEMRFLEVPKQSYLNYVGYADYSTTPRKG